MNADKTDKELLDEHPEWLAEFEQQLVVQWKSDSSIVLLKPTSPCSMTRRSDGLRVWKNIASGVRRICRRGSAITGFGISPKAEVRYNFARGSLTVQRRVVSSGQKPIYEH